MLITYPNQFLYYDNNLHFLWVSKLNGYCGYVNSIQLFLIRFHIYIVLCYGYNRIKQIVTLFTIRDQIELLGLVSSIELITKKLWNLNMNKNCKYRWICTVFIHMKGLKILLKYTSLLSGIFFKLRLNLEYDSLFSIRGLI